MRKIHESIWCDGGLIALSGERTPRMERQWNVWLYMSASIVIRIFLGTLGGLGSYLFKLAYRVYKTSYPLVC